MDIILIIEEISTWPKDIIDFLDNNYKAFIGWECVGEKESTPRQHDSLVEKLSCILKNYYLRGYHCTKLIKKEIIDIKMKGLKLQDGTTLSKRIDMLVINNYINSDIAEKLKNKNESNACGRKNKIWFCFYQPHHAGEDAITRFFNSWGGEALYNSHERDNETGVVLKKIGTPCIIETIVPMILIPNKYLPFSQIIRVFLKEKGYELDNSYEYEGYITENLPVENIQYVHEYPSNKFIKLSGCADWRRKLQE